MGTAPDYEAIIQQRASHVFGVMAARVAAAAKQKRKTGEPYILHPIAVATIAAEELQLGPNTVCAAFLHDVVEDTSYTLDDIRERFGEDVAYLVGVVTRPSPARRPPPQHAHPLIDAFRQADEDSRGNRLFLCPACQPPRLL